MVRNLNTLLEKHEHHCGKHPNECPKCENGYLNCIGCHCGGGAYYWAVKCDKCNTVYAYDSHDFKLEETKLHYNIMTKEQLEEVFQLARPLMKYIQANMNPHTKIVIDLASVAITEDVGFRPSNEFLDGTPIFIKKPS